MLALLALAPVTAELLQAYLGSLGGVVGLLFVVVFLAPLYGGAALLIREVALRTGRGWPGRLLLALAFGVAMVTLIDGSAFTVHRPDIDGWDQLVAGASFGGVGWAAVTIWVAGHVLLSIGSPLVVVEQTSRAPGPWLGRVALVVTAAAFVLVAALVHLDTTSTNDVRAGAGRYAASVVVVAALAGAAMSPLGRPVGQVPDRGAPRPGRCLAAAATVVATLAFVPPSWPGLAIDLAVLAAAGMLVLTWSRSPGRSPRHLAGLAFGAMLAQTLIGFLAPLPQNTTMAQKYSQNAVLLVLVLGLGVALERRTRSRAAP